MDTVSEQLFSRFEAHHGRGHLYGRRRRHISNAAVVLLWLIVAPASLVHPADGIGALSDLATLGSLVVSLVSLIGTAVSLTWIFNEAARTASHGPSLALHPFTVSQLKAVAYGSDVQEAVAVRRLRMANVALLRISSLTRVDRSRFGAGQRPRHRRRDPEIPQYRRKSNRG